MKKENINAENKITPTDRAEKFVRENIYLNTPQICEMLQISRPTLYRMIKEKRFPKGVSPTGTNLKWSLPTVKKWQASLIAS